MKNIVKKLKNKSGMTLVEAIIATALMSMVGILLASVFLISYKTASDQILTKEASENSASGMEYEISGHTVDFSGSGLKIENTEAASISVKYGGGYTQNCQGKMIKSVDEESGVTYYYFRSN